MNDVCVYLNPDTHRKKKSRLTENFSSDSIDVFMIAMCVKKDFFKDLFYTSIKKN